MFEHPADALIVKFDPALVIEPALDRIAVLASLADPQKAEIVATVQSAVVAKDSVESIQVLRLSFRTVLLTLRG